MLLKDHKIAAAYQAVSFFPTSGLFRTDGRYMYVADFSVRSRGTTEAAEVAREAQAPVLLLPSGKRDTIRPHYKHTNQLRPEDGVMNQPYSRTTGNSQ